MIDRFAVIRWAKLSLLALVCGAGLVACNGGGDDSVHVKGIVRSGDAGGLSGYNVSVYASFVDRPDGWQRVAVGSTDSRGAFDIFYDLPSSDRSVLVVTVRTPVIGPPVPFR